MADDKDSKTEQPTHKKLKDARKKAQVARSDEVAPTLTFLFVLIYFWLAWDWLQQELQDIVLFAGTLYDVEFRVALKHFFDLLIQKVLITIALPFTIMTTVAGILGNIMQFGFVLSADPIIPRPDKINPVSGFQRIFSMKSLVKTLLSILKICLISVALLIVVRTGFTELIHDVKQCDVLCQKLVLEDLFLFLIVAMIPLLVILVVADFIFQQAQFTKDQRMTKEEVKREYKEMEGDPFVKSALRGTQREILEQDMYGKIKQARVLVADVGFVVVLQYEEGVTPLPLILAMGKDIMARKMIEIAYKESVPVVDDPDLVQFLKLEGKVDEYIPSASIEAVARVIKQGANQQK